MTCVQFSTGLTNCHQNAEEINESRGLGEINGKGQLAYTQKTNQKVKNCPRQFQLFPLPSYRENSTNVWEMCRKCVGNVANSCANKFEINGKLYN